jgi:hypothetical protein
MLWRQFARATLYDDGSAHTRTFRRDHANEKAQHNLPKDERNLLSLSDCHGD